MHRTILILITLLTTTTLAQRDNKFTLINNVEIKGDYFITDQLENVYIIKNHQITKFNNKGIQQAIYSNSNLGSISYADASDPFRILLFYKNFNQIIFLDNFLSGIGSPILLDDLGIEQIEIACSSNQGGFWIFNNQTGQLFYYDKNLQLIQKSISLNSFPDFIASGRINNKPVYMIEKNDYIYLNIPESGIMVFDIFGAYYKTIHLKNIKSFQIVDGKIIYFQKNYLIKYCPKLLATDSILLPDTVNIINSRIEHNNIYIFTNNNFSIYKINY